MNSVGAPELVLILAALMLLFGYKKLPDAARSIGRSMRIFKAETKGLRGDEKGALTAAPGTVTETEEERERREFAEWKASRDASVPGSGSTER